MKPSVYVETSVISYLASRPARDLIVVAHQELTREWWEERSGRFELLISELVEQEAGAGDPDASRSRLAAIEGIAILTLSDEAVSLAEQLVGSGPIPREAAADALHIAVAAVNGIDYLLTWNCRHLANAALRLQIGALLENAGYACPVICTPEELMEG
jgi:predicted nucleic acid-binding protein